MTLRISPRENMFPELRHITRPSFLRHEACGGFRPPRRTSSRSRLAKLPYRSPSLPKKNTATKTSKPGESALSAQPKSERLPLDQLLQDRKSSIGGLVGAGIMAMLMSGYVTFQVVRFLRDSSSLVDETANPTGRPPDIDSSTPQEASGCSCGNDGAAGEASANRLSAEAFDRELENQEHHMGLTALRREIAARAHGHVLEVAIGTGRNLRLYDWTALGASSDEDEAFRQHKREQVCRLVDGEKAESERDISPILSFTGLDISSDMLSVARTRLRESVPILERILRRRRMEPMPRVQGFVVDVLDGRVRLFKGDAIRDPLPTPPDCARRSRDDGGAHVEHYDTVIQTFGLCSVADPVRLLGNMASATQPGTGRILLIEHGRGWWDWLNRQWLDRFAGSHFRRYGCWWNRDIKRIVDEAVQTVPGLEVVEFKRPRWTHFGTTLLIELRVRAPGEDEE